MAYKSIEDLRLYRCFSEAKYRCTNPNHKQFNDYGGRGIQFLFTSFKEFKKCLGSKPSDQYYAIDRIDNNGHYEIGNVKWSTRKENNSNKRTYKKRMP